ncbi:MAG: twin-arginine translocase subunit TatC [Thermodesulfobacteriota bacterium]
MNVAQSIIAVIVELRRTLLWVAGLVAGGSVACFLLSPRILAIIRGHLGQDLAWFTVTESFLALAKLSVLVTRFAVLPVLMLWLWRALVFRLSRRAAFGFAAGTVLLFYLGAGFCYLVTLPFGIDFLLGFQSEQLKPVISVDRFVSFVALFLLGFGSIFELPLFMVFAAQVGLCSRQRFRQGRRYAILAISVLSALLTPTPDVVNMALMGGPLYLLYEAGILCLRFVENKGPPAAG